MLSVERNTSGVEEEINVGMQAWSSVTGRIFGETDNDGRRASDG
jgi:hypothetical protein